MNSLAKSLMHFKPQAQGDGDPGTVQPDASHLTQARALISRVAIAQIYDGLATLCRQGRPTRDTSDLSESEEQHVEETTTLAVAAMSQLLEADLQDAVRTKVTDRLRLIGLAVKEQWDTHSATSAISQAIDDFARLVDDDDLPVRLRDEQLAVIRRQA